MEHLALPNDRVTRNGNCHPGRNGFLKADARNDPNSIQMARYEFLERALG